MKTDAAPVENQTAETDTEAEQKNTQLKIDVSTRLINFFKEFEFEPALRFANTLMLNARISKAAANRYVLNYMSVRDSYNQTNLAEKMKSPEWSQIIEDVAKIKSDKVINKRLVLMYGAPGTGKSTEAAMTYPDAERFACQANMQPDDLFRQFDFTDKEGHPVFAPTPITKAMMEGKPVILEEFNLLCDDSQRSLQSICDAGQKIIINNKEIIIKDGFMIIATFNLSTGRDIKPIADPIVDRAMKIKQFDMTPTLLSKYAF